MKTLITIFLAFVTTLAQAQYSWQTGGDKNEVLFLTGTISKGIAKDFNEILTRNPQIRFVVLKSPGGNVAEGVEMAKTIKTKRLNTVVLDRCASICTLIFAAGEERLVKETAIGLGFHSPYASTHEDYISASAFAHIEFYVFFMDEYKRYGVSEVLINKMMSTPSNSMAWVTAVNAGTLVTKIIK